MKRAVDRPPASSRRSSLLWELAVRSGRWSPVLLPSPVERRRIYLGRRCSTARCSRPPGSRCKRLLVGYVVGRRHRPAARASHQHVADPGGHRSGRSRSACRRCRASAGCRWRSSGSGRPKARCCSSSSWARSGRSSSRPITALAPSRRSMRARRAPWARRASTNGRG